MSKLRALFGVQAHAEILLWLLTHESARAADIARGTFYFPRTVDETLKELAASGMVKSARAGREKRYWLKPSEWSFSKRGTVRMGSLAGFTLQERIGVVLSNCDLSPILQASGGFSGRTASRAVARGNFRKHRILSRLDAKKPLETLPAVLTKWSGRRDSNSERKNRKRWSKA